MSINPVDEMKKCINVLEEGELDKQIEALETLKDWCEDDITLRIKPALDFDPFSKMLYSGVSLSFHFKK